MLKKEKFASDNTCEVLRLIAMLKAYGISNISSKFIDDSITSSIISFPINDAPDIGETEIRFELKVLRDHLVMFATVNGDMIESNDSINTTILPIDFDKESDPALANWDDSFIGILQLFCNWWDQRNVFIADLVKSLKLLNIPKNTAKSTVISEKFTCDQINIGYRHVERITKEPRDYNGIQKILDDYNLYHHGEVELVGTGGTPSPITKVSRFKFFVCNDTCFIVSRVSE